MAVEWPERWRRAPDRRDSRDDRSARRRRAPRDDRIDDPESDSRGLERQPVDLLDAVVRRFLRDDHVVDVAFAHAGGGDAHQLGVALQRRDVRQPQ